MYICLSSRDPSVVDGAPDDALGLMLFVVDG